MNSSIEPESSSDSRLVTLAIHTLIKAQEVRALLEAEGVAVYLQNINLLNPEIAPGVRLRIHEKDLPLALRIVENPEIFAPTQSSPDFSEKRCILVPVDFSEHSFQACRVAFDTAARTGTRVHLLHSYVNPYLSDTIQLAQTLSYDDSTDSGASRQYARANAEKNMESFEERVRDGIRMGVLQPAKFTSRIVEGVPEEAITEWANSNGPAFIVMGTRGAGDKVRDLVGSVTAEVLDSCRHTVVTVPATSCDHLSEKVSEIMMFVGLEQQDFIALDVLYRFLPQSHDIKVSFVKLDKKSRAAAGPAYASLLAYAGQHYPMCHFSVSVLSAGDLTELIASGTLPRPDLIVIPNKKKNIFARFFNPGIAHRLLFQADIPLMAIPV